MTDSACTISDEVFQPLFPAGMHKIEIESFEDRFVNPFPNSRTRSRLTRNLQAFITPFQTLSIPLEIWIDGSFTTEKLDPNDVDIYVLAMSYADINNLTNDMKKLFEALCSETGLTMLKMRFSLDVYFGFRENVNEYMYWRGVYGFDRRDNPTGIAKVTLP